MTTAKKCPDDKIERKKVRKEANEAEMTSSPALNDDAETDSGGVGEQDMPVGNRLD